MGFNMILFLVLIQNFHEQVDFCSLFTTDREKFDENFPRVMKQLQLVKEFEYCR